MLRLVSLMALGLTVASGQFNNHDFLRHPGQEFTQNAQGTRFTQQVSHGPPQQQQSPSQPQFSPQQQQPAFRPQPQPQFSNNQQQFAAQGQVGQQQIAAAISQLSPQQIASFLRQHPAVQQQLSQQQQQSGQPTFSPGPPSPQAAFRQPALQPAPQQQFRHQQPQAQPQPQPQQAAPQQQQPQPSTSASGILAPAKVHFANVGQQPSGDYQFGYHTGNGDKNSKDNSFREEMRLPDGTVKGSYGYIDANGKQRIIRYTAGKEGFQVEGDIHPDADPAAAAPQAPPQQQQQAQRQQSAPQPQFAPQPQRQQFAAQPSAQEGPGAALASFLNANGQRF